MNGAPAAAKSGLPFMGAVLQAERGQSLRVARPGTSLPINAFNDWPAPLTASPHGVTLAVEVHRQYALAPLCLRRTQIQAHDRFGAPALPQRGGHDHAKNPPRDTRIFRRKATVDCYTAV